MINHGSRRVRNGIGVMRAQTVQTTVVVQAGQYPGNGLPRSILMLFLVSKSGVAVGGETPHGCHLHPVRRAVEGGSKQEASRVFGSRWRRLPTLLHRVLRCAPAAFAAPAPVVVYATPTPVVEYIAQAPAASYAAPAPTVFAARVPVIEHISPALAVCTAPVPIVEYIAPAPVASYAVPAPAVFAAPAPVM